MSGSYHETHEEFLQLNASPHTHDLALRLRATGWFLNYGDQKVRLTWFRNVYELPEEELRTRLALATDKVVRKHDTATLAEKAKQDRERERLQPKILAEAQRTIRVDRALEAVRKPLLRTDKYGYMHTRDDWGSDLLDEVASR